VIFLIFFNSTVIFNDFHASHAIGVTTAQQLFLSRRTNSYCV